MHGTILQQWTPLLKNPANIEKNLARDCWTIVPVAVEHSCQWLLTNYASDCWRIVLGTVEQCCQWLLNNLGSDCWRITPATAEELGQWLLKNRWKKQSLERLFNSRWHDCSTVTGTIVQQSRAIFFFSMLVEFFNSDVKHQHSSTLKNRAIYQEYDIWS